MPPSASIDEIIAALGPDLPSGPGQPEATIELLARAAEPGLTAMASGRFFGFVIGGTLPAALASDWLVSAWDQNAGLRQVTPTNSAIEDITSGWLLDLLGLPGDCAVGFVTGATLSNFTCLAAARQEVLQRVGWDVNHDGLTGAPGVRVIVGAERHDTVDVALRYLGLGAPQIVAADRQGRIDLDALTEALAGVNDEPTIVVLQAGNVHSGAFDDFTAAIGVAHQHGAWVHVDGAFGLFAAASTTYGPLTRGLAEADSWTTDAHKTLNAPYDCGLAIVRRPAALRAAMGMHGDYLIQDESGDPFEYVPETSRRARAIPVWAALHSLGRSGVAALVDGYGHHAQTIATELAGWPGVEVLNYVCFTQVCACFGNDEQTESVVQAMLADGTAWMTGSKWQGRSVLRISVSNWSTTEDDVRRSLNALRSHWPPKG